VPPEEDPRDALIREQAARLAGQAEEIAGQAERISVLVESRHFRGHFHYAAFGVQLSNWRS
jgi:indole-3-glycerol phosphate synthase